MRRLLILPLLIFSLTWAAPSQAAGFVSANLWLSNEHPLVGSSVKISSVIANEDPHIFGGLIQFESDGQIIAPAENFELAGNDNSRVFSVTWNPTAGQHTVRAVLTATYFIGAQSQHLPTDGNVISNSLGVFVDVDSDGDTIPDQQETANGTNPQSADTDGDTDPDNTDPAPSNSKVFSVPDGDGDKIPDALDSDLDNDGLYNWEEDALGTNPRLFDTDGDGVGDKQDAFPLDSRRSQISAQTGSVIADDAGEVLGEKIYAPFDSEYSDAMPPVTASRRALWPSIPWWKIIITTILLFLALIFIEAKIYSRKPSLPKHF